MEAKINHSLYTILEFVAQFYKMSTEEVTSESQKQEVVKARKMIMLIADNRPDRITAKFLGMSRSNIVNARKAILENMTFDKKLRDEYEKIKHGLLYYEIDGVFIRKNYLSLS